MFYGASKKYYANLFASIRKLFIHYLITVIIWWSEHVNCLMSSVFAHLHRVCLERAD